MTTSKPYQILPLTPASFPKMINKTAPAKPINTPTAFVQKKGVLKNRMPNARVKSGVRELKTPVMELLIWVCAKENKKAGKKLPANPTTAKYFHFVQSIFLKRKMKIGKKARAEILIRNEATCSGLKASNPFFIKTYELPQTSPRNSNNNQAFRPGALVKFVVDGCKGEIF